MKRYCRASFILYSKEVIGLKVFRGFKVRLRPTKQQEHQSVQ